MSLAVEALTKSFGAQQVLAGVSCEFPAGQISTVLGISGSGKTTLLRIIAGLEQADGGDVFLGGERITTRLPQERNLGFVFQDLALYPHLTVERNIVLPLWAQGCGRREAGERVTRIAAEFGLDKFLSRRAGSLSGGEAQRLALARSLVREPVLTLLDEPFSHLDAPLQRESRRFVFSTLRERGATAVLVTHNHQDAQEAGGKVVFLDEGRIVQEGSWGDLYRRPVTAQVARVVSFLEPVVLRGRIVASGNRVVLECPDLGLHLRIDGSVQGTTPPPAQLAMVMVRPEDLRVEADCTAQGRVTGWNEASGRLCGEVVGSVMAGPLLFYQLRHKSGLQFAALAGEPRHPNGSGLAVDLDAAPKMVFPALFSGDARS
jgi:multiple sugar transport system ATP-binding protein